MCDWNFGRHIVIVIAWCQLTYWRVSIFNMGISIKARILIKHCWAEKKDENRQMSLFKPRVQLEYWG